MRGDRDRPGPEPEPDTGHHATQAGHRYRHQTPREGVKEHHATQAGHRYRHQTPREGVKDHQMCARRMRSERPVSRAAVMHERRRSAKQRGNRTGSREEMEQRVKMSEDEETRNPCMTPSLCLAPVRSRPVPNSRSPRTVFNACAAALLRCLAQRLSSIACQ